MSFKELDPQPNFPKIEEEVQKYWGDKDILKKYLERNNASEKNFSFIDGPITANNPMGVHHAWGRSIKDMYQRFKNMQGYKQRFQNGFDCQGLWVEVEVEKEKGFNSKKDIEQFGVANFTNACKERVAKFANIQTEQSKRLGMFMDWENSYFTNSETNNLYIWHFFKVVAERGLLYKDKSSATWCPRCETGLSQHEQSESYKDIEDTSVYVKFALKGRPGEYVLAWTTTPWTLSANVLLAINTKFEYVKAKIGEDTLYLAKEAAKRLGIENYQDTDAKTLLGLEYESLYKIPAQEGVTHKVVEWQLVDPSEGTGVVHVAPGCGQEDYELGKELGADMISPLNTSGVFIDGFGDLSGKYAHNVSQEVIAYLENTKALFKTEKVTHRYPHCWRCGTKCLFRLENDWFIDLSSVRPKLKEQAKKANWMPDFAGKRMQNWLDNMGNWMISRKRYYGLALPFYECSCGQLTVIGSKEELKEKAINPEKVGQLPSLHRPWIDEIKIKCPKCGENVSRIPDVGDVWLDAGVVPFSTLKYLEDKSYWEKWFPAEFICEMVEQIRLWYYSMLVYGVILEAEVPYLNVVNYMEVRDEKGERISKTKRNGIPYNDAVERMGADIMRWLYAKQGLESPLNFGYTPADEARRRFFLILWNSIKFFTTFANLENWQVRNFDPQVDNHILDRWIVSKFNNLIKQSTINMEQYNHPKVAEGIENFVIKDLSTWYIRRSRDRSGDSHLAVLHHIILNLLRLMAPTTPHFCEHTYQSLGGRKESVHLENWPEFDESAIDAKLESDMELVRLVAEKGHALRKEASIKVRQPLQSLVVFLPSTPSEPSLPEVLKNELNVKEVTFKKGPELRLELDTKITPDLELEGSAREFMREIQNLRKEASCRLTDLVVVSYPEKYSKVVEKFGEEIKKKTLVKEFTKSNAEKITVNL